MTLYDMLIQNQTIENAFLDWKEYRKALTLHILEQIPPKKTVAILGAGMCNDLDLDLLIDHVNYLYLVDKIKPKETDIYSHYPYAKKYKDKIEFMELDFVGITDEEYRIFSERLVRLVQIEKENTNIEDLAKLVSLHMKELYEKALNRSIFTVDVQFDYVIAVGLHSQLNNMFAWMWEIVLKNLKQKDVSVFTFISSYNEKIIQKFHEKLLEHVKEGLIIGCEKARVGQSDLIQGSIQAMWDFKQRIQTRQVVCMDQAYIYWPFDIKQNIVFDVELLHLKMVSQK